MRTLTRVTAVTRWWNKLNLHSIHSLYLLWWPSHCQPSHNVQCSKPLCGVRNQKNTNPRHPPHFLSPFLRCVTWRCQPGIIGDCAVCLLSVTRDSHEVSRGQRSPHTSSDTAAVTLTLLCGCIFSADTSLTPALTLQLSLTLVCIKCCPNVPDYAAPASEAGEMRIFMADGETTLVVINSCRDTHSPDMFCHPDSGSSGVQPTVDTTNEHWNRSLNTEIRIAACTSELISSEDNSGHGKK